MEYVSSEFLRMFVLKGLLLSLLKTELLECSASLWFKGRNKQDLLLVVLLNLATNPATVFLDFLFRYRFFNPVVWIILLEGAVWLTESLVYRKYLRQKTNPFLFSFVLNAASYGIGWILGRLYT